MKKIVYRTNFWERKTKITNLDLFIIMTSGWFFVPLATLLTKFFGFMCMIVWCIIAFYIIIMSYQKKYQVKYKISKENP